MAAHDDELSEKLICLIIDSGKTGGKLTKEAFIKAIEAFLDNTEQRPKSKGEQTLAELTSQGAGVESIEISSNSIDSFKEILNKYEVDYAAETGDNDISKVFFKPRDTEVITTAFKEYANKELTDNNIEDISKNNTDTDELTNEASKIIDELNVINQKYNESQAEQAEQSSKPSKANKSNKQTVEELLTKEYSQKVRINEKNIGSFEEIARKHNIEYIPLKDTREEPPKYLVFIKSPNERVLKTALKKYLDEVKKEKPSISITLGQNLEKIKNQILDVTKKKERLPR